MLDRRCFLAGAAGLTLAAKIEQARATPPSVGELPNVLGRPTSTANDSSHPIAPERVIVLDKGNCRGPALAQHPSLRAELAKPICLNRGHDRPLDYCQLPEAKLDPVLQIMNVMAGYYRSPQLHVRWSRGLTCREALASTGLGRGFALVHQFQDDAAVQTRNDHIDWWLILSPTGIDWASFDGEPVFGMLAHVFPAPQSNAIGLRMRAWCPATVVGHQVGASLGWPHIARLSRPHAARVVNRAIHAALPCI
ncbi:MAG TPA: hypothetical protein VF278_16515 [Pirellulales bacterium]